MITNDTCYILALFKRDDGERLLLGSGYYPFADSQKHFVANAFANDVLELQGTDGQLLTGQVRRSQSQPFDGFIGDGTTIKTIVEQKRREFFLFFRKQHHYTVVYIMPDGTAIKRDRGYITDAPAVQELYQVQPKYHIALAFEDVNYYSYAEDAQGNEIYSFNATLGLANIEDGGLVWDANGAVSDNTGLEDIQINGDTFQQSYDGGNLFDGTIEVGSISSTTGEDTTAQNRLRTAGLTPIGFGGALSITATNAGQGTPQCAPRFYRADGSYIGNGGYSWLNLPVTINPTANSAYIRLIFHYTPDAEQDPANIQDLQIKAPAVPSPSHPQQIQTVTGTQTITINGTNYSLDLGSIELCKLGTYQDYIWKDGEDWKIHKNTNRFTFEQPQTVGLTKQPLGFVYNIDNNPLTGKYIPLVGKCSHFEVEPTTTAWTAINKVGMNTVGALWFRTAASNQGDTRTIEEFGQWLVDARVSFAYALETPTDTTITDQTLIAQLEAIAEAMDKNGKPTTITANDQNLPAIIVGEPNGTGGYIFAPSTGGGPINVTVNGVDSANPVWHVVGPATNPTLTNSTTGEALVWNGTVPNNQELIIDMGAQTATMEGANVFEYVSGSWIQLAPGINRVSYTAANTTNSSTIYWNEVVG